MKNIRLSICILALASLFYVLAPVAAFAQDWDDIDPDHPIPTTMTLMGIGQ